MIFVSLDSTIRMRVSKDEEMIGPDDSKHGGQTFPETTKDVTPI